MNEPYFRILLIVRLRSLDASERELRAEMLAGVSLGAIIDSYAPDPGPGAKIEVEIVGSARLVQSSEPEP